MAKNRAIERFFEVFDVDKVADKIADKGKVVRVQIGQGADKTRKNGQEVTKLSACCPHKKSPRVIRGLWVYSVLVS